MSSSAENGLMSAMRAHGITPPSSIVWDGKRHRFCSENGGTRKKNGWYTAYPDPPKSANFGCWKLGVNQNWTLGKEDAGDDFDPVAFAKIMEQRDAEREAGWAKVAAECTKRFAEAVEPNPDHPYLVKKGIIEPEGIKQDGSKLLIPMRAMERGNPIISIQEIDAKGEKRFAVGGRMAHTRFTVGGSAFDPQGPVIITEGWATGCSIHEATGHPCIVAFSAYNLTNVARRTRIKYPKVQIIVAADNDRWTKGPKGHNPGVTAAKEAAMAVDGLVAIPEFKDLSSKPTDFNDLMALEGKEAVVKWMDPAMAHHVDIHPPQEIPRTPGHKYDPEWGATPDEEIEGRPIEEELSLIDRANFRCLGYNRDLYYYMGEEKAQMTILSPQQHTKLTLMQFAPLSWWEMAFPSKKEGCNWGAAVDALYRANHKKGVFMNDNLRGRGCWTVEDEDGKPGMILHLGDRLLPPGGKKFVDPETYECTEGRIYERAGRLAGPSKTKALDLDEAKNVLSLYQDLLWHDKPSGLLLAGWTVLAPLGGSLPWRPHVWITGGAGSGKSTVIRELVHPLLGDMSFYYEGITTEAGIRQDIQSDALPVCYDEAERSGKKAEDRLQAIIGLARSASSTADAAKTAKGSQGGKAVKFHVRSMFCLASIGGALSADSDRQRFAVLQMKSKGNLKKGEKEEHWREYEPRLSAVDHNMGRELIARTLKWQRDGRLAQTLDVFKKAAAASMGDSRFGDQYGTLYAGAWTLMSDEAPATEEEAKHILETVSLDHYTEDQEIEGILCLRILMQKQERVDTQYGMKTFTVGQLVEIAHGDPTPGITIDEAENYLKQLGLKVLLIDGARKLQVAHNSDWIKASLIQTPFANVATALRTLPGVTHTAAVRFGGFVSRSSLIFLDDLEI